MLPINIILLLSLILPITSLTNKFGIGCYDDTPGSPPITSQLDAAQKLAGAQGWVTIYLCSWKHATHSCMNKTTQEATPDAKAKVLAAYARNLSVVARIGNPYYVRDHADVNPDGTINTTSYKELASAYAKYIRSLPLPSLSSSSSSSSLYITIGNEFNACNEWKCSASSLKNMSALEMANEVAHFADDVAHALIPIRKECNGTLLYGHGAIANWHLSKCQCSTGKSLGVGRSGLTFLQQMIDFIPDLYSHSNVDWLSSHSYPFSQSAWSNPKCQRGLKYYRNESVLIQRPTINVILTETGWNLRTGYTTMSNRANWTVKAYQEIWMPDQQVIGTTPFLLGGLFWENNRNSFWPWMSVDQKTGLLQAKPVYKAVQKLSCGLFPGVNCMLK